MQYTLKLIWYTFCRRTLSHIHLRVIKPYNFYLELFFSLNSHLPYLLIFYCRVFLSRFIAFCFLLFSSCICRCAKIYRIRNSRYHFPTTASVSNSMLHPFFTENFFFTFFVISSSLQKKGRYIAL